MIWPSKFDWREFLRIDLIEDHSQQSSSLPSGQTSDEAVDQTNKTIDAEKETYIISGQRSSQVPDPAIAKSNSKVSLDDIVHPFDPETLKHIRKWFKIASVYFVVNVLVTIVLWPLPLYRDYIFTVSFFDGWVTMAIIWHFFAILAVIVYPIYDGRHEIARVFYGVKKEWKK